MTTIRRVSRPRGELTPEQEQSIRAATERAEASEAERRAAVVAALTAGASFLEVSRFTGLSTNTLQRWKREAAS